MSPTEQAKVHFDNAFAFLQRGRIDEAINQLSMAISIEDRAEYYYHRSHLHLERADLASATQDLNKAEQLLKQGQICDLAKEDIEALRAQIDNPTRTGGQDRRGQLGSYAEKRQLEPLLNELGLGKFAAQLKSLVLPSVRLKPTGGTAPTCGSKLGGFPDLPSRFDWPVNGQNIPMAFVCQLTLRHIPPCLNPPPLPSKGLMYGFFDAASAARGTEAEFRVAYNSDTEHTSVIHAPDRTPHENSFFEAAVAVVAEDSLPDWDHPSIQKLLPAGARAEYQELLNIWYGPQPWHRLLGYSQGVQSCVEAELGEAFRLLIQIDDDSDCCMEWGREGRLYFATSEKQPLKLAQADCRVVMQSR